MTSNLHMIQCVVLLWIKGKGAWYRNNHDWTNLKTSTAQVLM